MLTQEQATTLERKIERFSQILAKNPGDGLTVLALAEASFRRGLKLEALTAYQTVTKEQPVPEAHLAVAEIYSQQNMTTEAYGELRCLFELDPENVEARLLIRVLERQSAPPDDIQTILRTPASDEAFYEARLRLQIQRAIHNRELQERTRNGTLEPGVVIHEYYIEEAKKKLIEVDEQLRKLDDLKDYNATLYALPVPEPVSAQVEAADDLEVGFTIEHELASAMEDFQKEPDEEIRDLEPAADELPSYQTEPVAQVDLGADLEVLSTLETPLSVPEEVEGTSMEPTDSEMPSEGHDSPLASGTAEDEAPDLVLLRDPELDPVAPEPTVIASDGPGVLDFPPVPPAAEDFDVPALDDELPPYPEQIDEDSTIHPVQDIPTDAILEEPSIDLSIPLEVTSALNPELPDFDETEPLKLQVSAVEPETGTGGSMPEPRLNDAMQDSATVSRSGFGAPPAIEPISFGESEVAVATSVEPELQTLPEIDEHSSPTEEPEIVISIAEVQEEISEPAASPGMSAAARQAYYESKAEEIGKLTGTLARTRGVSSIFLVARDGTTIDSVVKDDITEARVGELVKESFEFLSAYADSPAYWVLECAGGIFVMQTLDSEHVLIAIGQAGANFGALRYTMDKTKAKFESILQNIPR